MSHAATRRHRKTAAHEEEHENSERWLVTYADMLTLLMVLFIVLFAISQVDQKKYAQLKTGLASGFGAPAPAFSSDTGVLADGGSKDAPLDVTLPSLTGPQAETVKKAAAQAVKAAALKNADDQQKSASAEVRRLEAIKKAINKALAAIGMAGSARYRITDRGLVVTILTSSVVFAGDRAELLPQGQRIVGAVGDVLRTLPNGVEVDGHTNQLPVPTRNYPSAWELSTARASSVVRYLVSYEGIAPRRLQAAGFAGEQPLYPPKDPRSVTLNRRVEIVVLSDVPPEIRALLSAVTPAN
ncbi:MAG: flagellar motor protein MotB [Pseudonocardiales bacterium]|nr:MAG: flagellar motor protein MotB [Pseudonocardiales bacterium]